MRRHTSALASMLASAVVLGAFGVPGTRADAPGAAYAADDLVVVEQAAGPLVATAPETAILRAHESFTRQLVATGGSGTRTWKKTSGPAWLTVGADGVVRGTPTAAGTFSYVATVTSDKATAQVTGTVVVYGERYLDVENVSVDAAMERVKEVPVTVHPRAGERVSFSLVDPYEWTTISPDGRIRMEPPFLGSYTVAVKVTAQTGVASKPSYEELVFVWVHVVKALEVKPLSVTVAPGNQFRIHVGASGGDEGSYDVELVGAPAGVKVDEWGTLEGTLPKAGTYTFSVRVRSGWQTVTAPVTVVVRAAGAAPDPAEPTAKPTSKPKDDPDPKKDPKPGPKDEPAAKKDESAPSSKAKGEPTNGPAPAPSSGTTPTPGPSATADPGPGTSPAPSSGSTPAPGPGTVTTGPALTARATKGRPVRVSAASSPGLAWRVTSGALPSGLSLTTTGFLTGTPTSAGTRTVVVEGTAAGRRTTRKVTVTVAAPVKAKAKKSKVSVRKGRKVRLKVTVSRGTPGYRFTTVGRLPKGLKLKVAANGRSATVTGRARKKGAYVVKVRATDSQGSSRTKRLRIRVK